ncbi:MAG TPA: carboxypeptidase-like regulatory domain-containing protein [Cyclobacteriaceae bacterium]|nr:carboxypeptidase-like regulatory domain-containing protein [Cyclobacteriaceae bacterium]
MMKFYQLTKRLMLVLLLATGLTAYGQSYQVSGVVKDARSGEGIVGVNVSVKGTSQGTITDVNGNFSVEATGNAVLIFSFIGYQTKEVNVTSSKTSINVSLEEDVTSLEEVVVSGLASSVKRSNLANAVGSVSAKDLLGTTQIQTTDAAMYGKVPGANIRQNGGAPGGGMSILLRGFTTLGGSSQPLIILDGVYIDNSFQSVVRGHQLRTMVRIVWRI